MDSPCWIWTRAKSRGYAVVGKNRLGGTTVLAHRIAYEAFRGPVPEGMQLDHRCHNEDKDCLGGPLCPHRACVNPWHLVPSTGQQNLLRGNTLAAANAAKTHCPNDHPYEGDNLYLLPNGARGCVECRREAGRESYRRRQRAKGITVKVRGPYTAREN